MDDKFFDKKSKGSGIAVLLANKSANETNYQLANELHKPIIRKFLKRKLYSYFRDNIWGVGLADMQSLSKYREHKYSKQARQHSLYHFTNNAGRRHLPY